MNQKRDILEKHAKDFVPVFAAFYEDSLQTAEVERGSIQQLIITCLHHLKCYVQSEGFQQLDKFRSSYNSITIRRLNHRRPQL